MIIRASTLINRFYKHDGWTQQEVFNHLHTINDKPPTPQDLPVVEDRGEYYAVYHQQAIFKPTILEHQYQPYSSTCISDRFFWSKNKVQGRERHYT